MFYDLRVWIAFCIFLPASILLRSTAPHPEAPHVGSTRSLPLSIRRAGDSVPVERRGGDGQRTCERGERGRVLRGCLSGPGHRRGWCRRGRAWRHREPHGCGDDRSAVRRACAKCVGHGRGSAVADECVAAANKAIHQLFSTGKTATTVVAGAFVEGGVHVAHVGDSRAYRLRAGQLEQLTEDHSLLNVYLREGVLTPETAKTFKLRNVLTRGVGHRGEVEVDCSFHMHRPGDRYLFCTDGLTDLLNSEEITAVLLTYQDDDAMAAEALCDAAWDAGGHDNITTVVVRPGGAGR